MIFGILLLIYVVFFLFILFSKKVEIKMNTGPATRGERLLCAFIWPIIGTAILWGILRGTCKIKRTK